MVKNAANEKFIPMILSLIWHPVTVPPCDEFNNTYELENKKNPAPFVKTKALQLIECNQLNENCSTFNSKNGTST